MQAQLQQIGQQLANLSADSSPEQLNRALQWAMSELQKISREHSTDTFYHSAKRLAENNATLEAIASSEIPDIDQALETMKDSSTHIKVCRAKLDEFTQQLSEMGDRI